MERFFFLDDADRELIESKRRSHNRLGFAVQLTTVRYLGVFLDGPTDVPAEVVDYLAEQFGITDASVLKVYGEREKTRFEIGYVVLGALMDGLGSSVGMATYAAVPLLGCLLWLPALLRGARVTTETEKPGSCTTAGTVSSLPQITGSLHARPRRRLRRS
ncbi:hypothetical protein GCM10018966_097000 [Streptomyces yanii]